MGNAVMSTKESDLVTAAFIYVSRAIAEGDVDALQRCGSV